jgi:hypothetical protein
MRERKRRMQMKIQTGYDGADDARYLAGADGWRVPERRDAA